jgi:hypothetical protein
MDSKELSLLILKKHIEDVDLSNIDLNGYDFSECIIKNVIFAAVNQQDRELKNINFKNAQIEHVLFDNATLENCNFDVAKPDDDKAEKKKTVDDKPSMVRVSFRNCKLISCRFRNAKISWSDFRYSEINQATFEDSEIDFCDFYRTFFMGVVIFRKSKISNSSLYYTYFNEGATIRKENILKGRILQQDKVVYRKFLVDWKTKGTGVRKNNQKNSKSAWSPDKSLKVRFADAEDIYKNLNGLWMSKGYLGDANWAYIKGRKMERKRMIAELTSENISIYQKLINLVFIFWNFLSDAMFGYGESIRKMILSYIITVMLFAYFYYASSEVSLPTYVCAIGISLKNMVAMSSDEITNASPLIDFLNIIQTTIGILITGIFGFILGNKIRNQ